MSEALTLTKKEKIKVLQARIENFKKSISDPNTFTYSLYQSNSPKKDAIRAWGEALEDLHKLGVYTDEIWTISTHIRNELRAMGAQQAMDWAKKVLPFKYKDKAKIHAEVLLQDELKSRGIEYHDTKDPNHIQFINKPYIDELIEDIKLFGKAIKYLKSHNLLDRMHPDELNEFVTRRKASRNMLYEIMDGRMMVPTSKFAVFMEAYAEGTKSATFTNFLKHIREITELTPKQTVKLLTGRVTKVDILYEPKNRIYAKKANFYGVQCGECGSWRQEIKYHPDITKDMLYCYACKSWNTLKSEKLVSKLV